MTAILTPTSVPVAWRRHGRSGWSYKINGEKVQSVTGIIDAGVPKPALQGWNAREVAAAAVRLRDIIPALSDDELTDLLSGAPRRVRNKAANRGTEVHNLAEKIARGLAVDVPPELEAHVQHYIDFLAAWELSDAQLERPVFHEELKYGGRTDLFARSPRVGYALWDIKTSGSGIYGEIALQLAGYSRAQWYVAEDGQVLPVPKFDACMAIWVTEHGADAFQITVDEAEWKCFRSAAFTAWWREHRMDRVVSDSMWQSRVVA